MRRRRTFHREPGDIPMPPPGLIPALLRPCTMRCLWLTN